jgi:hypothetical protein
MDKPGNPAAKKAGLHHRPAFKFCSRPLIVNLVHFMAKHFRHQDTKTQKYILTKGFHLRLSAFAAIFSGLSGLGVNYGLTFPNLV